MTPYVKIAAALEAVRPAGGTPISDAMKEQHDRDVTAVMTALAASFPNFDAARFFAAATGAK